MCKWIPQPNGDVLVQLCLDALQEIFKDGPELVRLIERPDGSSSNSSTPRE